MDQLWGFVIMAVCVGGAFLYFRQPAKPAKLPRAEAEDGDELLRLVRNGRKGEAVQRYREQTGLSAAEAKANVEALARGEGVPHPVPLGCVPPRYQERFVRGPGQAGSE